MNKEGIVGMVWLRRLILSIQFLTRIPIPIQLQVDEIDFSKCTIFFPFVGVVVGLVMGLFALGASTLSFSWFPMAVAVLIEVLITGALHLDGLGDTCDGIFSNRPKERVLEIMRDSRIGTNAGAAIFFDLAFKILLLLEIQQRVGSAWMGVMLAMPAVGRMGIVTAASVSHYARKEGGLGKHFLDRVGMSEWLGSTILGGFILYGVLGTPAFLFIVVTDAVAFLLAKYLEKRLDGLTGDTLGAVNEICEIFFLFICIVV